MIGQTLQIGTNGMMGTTLRQMPVFIPLLCYILGIVVGTYLGFTTWIYLISVGCLLLSLIGYKLYKPLFIFSIICLFISLGIEAEHINRLSLQCPSCETHLNQQITISAFVSSEITANPKTKANRFTINTGIQPQISLQAITYDSASTKLLIGDEIRIIGKLQAILPPNSPRQFDYKRFMEIKGISYQMNVSEIQYSHKYRKSLLRNIQKIRIVCNRKITRHIQNKYAQQVCLAMTLGDKKGLDSATIQTFRETGTSHYMAVSGLHVDLVSLILLSFFKYLKIKKIGWRLIKFLSFTSFIWFYACLVGLSPSVMRAACMFSIYSFGSIYHLPTNHWNTLSLTAGALLLFRPSFLFDLGFQLSFIAVISIVVYYPFISKYIRTSSWLINKFVSAIIVTLSVQVLIFPLNLYYFHQFPLNFIIANTYLWLFALILIYGSIFLIACSFISSTLAGLIGKLIEYISYILNKSLQYIQQFDSLIITDVWLTPLELLSIYLTIICGTWCLFHLRKTSIICFVLSLALNVELQLHKEENTLSSAFIYIYPTYGEFRIDFIYDSSCYTYSTHDISLSSAIQNNRSYHAIDQLHQLNLIDCYEDDMLWKFENAFEFFGKTLLVQANQTVDNVCQYDFVIDLNASEDNTCHESIFIHKNNKLKASKALHHLQSQGAFVHTIDLR